MAKKKKTVKVDVFVLTRKILRNVFRYRYGNSSLQGAWQRLQVKQDQRGKRKLFIEERKVPKGMR